MMILPQVLRLDSWLRNVVRTPANPNLQEASLPFQYQWANVTEAASCKAQFDGSRHLIWNRAYRLAIWDSYLAARLSNTVLADAAAKIPDCFLTSLLASAPTVEKVERRRQAHAAFWWKRLKAPHLFLNM